MFEPLSALAVLGFASGTLGFVVSTISKVDEKRHEIRECESRLRSFNLQLEDAYLELKVWHSIWIGEKAFSNETYVHFWGSEGLDNVQSRIDSITELSNGIRKLLRQPVDRDNEQSLPRSELKEWHDLIHNDAKVPSWRRTACNRAGLVRKIAFALFDNAILLEKIGRVKSEVEGLRNFTQYTFRLRQKSNPRREVTLRELGRISDLKAFVDRISAFGSILYDRRSSDPRLEWRLELGPPEAGYALDLWSEVDTMYIDFIVKDTTLQMQTRAIRVRIHVVEQLAPTNDYLQLMVQRVDQLVLNGRQQEYDPEHDRSFSLLEEPSRRSRPLRRMLTDGIFSGEKRKNFEVERADLVYGLGHWMVLLWNTPWSCDLCTCGIRCTHLADTCTRHSFLPCPERSHRYPVCHSSDLAENRSKLLGVALAEIALALPISIMTVPDDTKYLVGEELASRKRLLGMLRDKFGRKTITKAVSYCLDPESVTLGDSLLPDHFEQYCQNIVLPLQAYHKVINKHFQSAPAKPTGEAVHLYSYYDDNEDTDFTQHNVNKRRDSSGCNEYEDKDEDAEFSNDNEDT